MSQPLLAIPKICTTSAGISSIVMTLPANIATPPTTSINATLDFIDPDAVFSIAFTRSTARFRENARTGPGGDYYESELSAFIPKRRIEMETLITRLRNRRVHGIYIDRNGNQFIVWNARFFHQYDSGDRPGTREGYSISLNASNIRDVPIISGNEELPEPPGPSDPPESCCITINPLALPSPPPPSGNTQYLSQIVSTIDGTVYFIDKNGLAIALGRPAPGYFTVLVPDGVTNFISAPPEVELPDPADFPFPTYNVQVEMSKRVWVKRERTWLIYGTDFNVDFAQQRINFIGPAPKPSRELIETYVYKFPV